MSEFKPKDAEVLKSEITADLGIEYEGNEEMVDKLVARGLKDEEFKASLHTDKAKHLESKRAKEELLRKAGLNPETGEKIEANGSKSSPDMSLKDIRALQDVHDDDVDDVIEWSKVKGISIAEAKRLPVIQALLKTRTEERATAAAANATTTRRSSSTNSSEALLSKLSKGDLADDEVSLAAKAMVQSLKGK